MIWIPLIGLAAFVVKSATGFGPALIIVGVGTLAIGIEHSVPLAAMFDLVSGLVLMRQVRGVERPPIWRPMAVLIAVTSAAGAALFTGVDASLLLRPLGVVIIVSAVAIALQRRREPAASGELRRGVALGAAGLGGVLGGLLGVSGPPVVLAASSRLSKDAFRALVAPVFLASAVVRVGLYGATGAITLPSLQALGLTLLVLPLGAALGDRVHRLMTERAFLLVVTALLTVTGLNLLR